MNDLIGRMQRELPDTDKTRYDAAYERGKAQARSGLLFGGLAFGAAVGAALMFLFDPNRGAGRRAQLASRATGIRNDLARTASGRVEDLQNRAKGAAIEAGIRRPDGDRASGRSNGTPVAAAAVGAPYDESRLLDDDAPGGHVPDPIRPDEVEQYGASGPIAGAAATDDRTDAEREAAERAARQGI